MNYYKRIFEQLQEFKSNEELCDVILTCEEKEFKLHKILLSASSAYFKKLLTDIKEPSANKIDIKGITLEAFETCIKFVYYGEAELDDKNIREVYDASYMLQIKDLKKQCFTFMADNLNINNCISMYNWAVLFNEKEIKNLAEDIVFKNAEYFVSDMDKYDIDLEMFQTMLMSEELCVSSETVLFDALIKWINGDEKHRSLYLCELLPLVRLPVLPNDYFTNTVMEVKHITTDCEECKNYFLQSVAYQLNKKRGKLLDIQIKQRRFTAGKSEDSPKPVEVEPIDNNTMASSSNIEDGTVEDKSGKYSLRGRRSYVKSEESSEEESDNQEEESENEEEEEEDNLEKEEIADDASEEESEDDDYEIDEEDQHEMCQTIMRKIMEYRCSKEFKYPVDTEDVPDYLEVIENPISLSEIQEKINFNSKYVAQNLLEDMKLLYDNADKYNLSTSYVMSQCNKFITIFKRIFGEKFSKDKSIMKSLYDIGL